MSLTLYYYPNARGFGEKVRMMLAETGMKYQEVAVEPKTVEEWTATGKLNFGKLPALQHGDIIIEQSCAIIEYVAELADKEKRGQGGNKYLGDPKQTPILRGYNHAVHDFQQEIQTYLGKENKPDNAAQIISKWFGLFNAILVRNEDNDVKADDFLLGKNFTFADVACFEAVNAVINIYGLNVLRPFPKLKEFHDKVAAHARIEHHIQTRAPGF